MTLKERLENHLLLNKRINPLEAWTRLGIYRLSAVIYDLRKEGYNIVSHRKAVKNQFNESCHVAEYELIK